MYFSSPFYKQRHRGHCVCPHSVRDPLLHRWSQTANRGSVGAEDFIQQHHPFPSQSLNTKPCDLKWELLTKLRTRFNPPDLFYPCALEYMLAAEALLSSELSQPQNPRTCMTKWCFFLIHWQDDSNLHGRYKTLTYQMQKPSEVENDSGCLNRKVVYKVFPWL